MAGHTDQWKRTEKSVAAKLNGQRVGITGLATEDVITSQYVVECKHRKEIPQWLHAAMAQAQGAATRKPGHLALVVLHQSGQRHNDDYVVVRMADFIEWFGGVEVTEGEIS